MNLEIKVKYFDKNMPRLEVSKKGDWVDLYVTENKEFNGVRNSVNIKTVKDGKIKTSTSDCTFQRTLLTLGVAMELPEGFEAIVAPRSSISKTPLMMANGIGIIDNSYSGNNDEWKLPLISFGKYKVNKYDRLCQFRIQPSQKSSFKTKLKWLFSNGIKFVEVDSLKKEDRKGFGSTGK